MIVFKFCASGFIFFSPCILEFQFRRLWGLIGTQLSSSLVPFSSPPLSLTYTAEMEIGDNGSIGMA